MLTAKDCTSDICDCDNVLWNGIAGEESIFMDERNVRFQNMLIELYGKGVLLCLCSRNLQEHIDRAFADLTMPLEKKHILISKINLSNKAENIVALRHFIAQYAVEFFCVFSVIRVIGRRCDLLKYLIVELSVIYRDFSHSVCRKSVKNCRVGKKHLQLVIV